ncbi:MAG: SRPBCC family protein [Coprobacillaceae bacterium]
MITVNIKATFDCDIDSLWEIVTNNKEYHWRSDLSKVEVKDDKTFIEYTHKNYPTTFTITKLERNKVYEFDIKNTNIHGHWIGVFKENSTGTEISFTEMIEVNNIAMRLLGKTYLKKQQKLYVKDLQEKVNQLKRK